MCANPANNTTKVSICNLYEGVRAEARGLRFLRFSSGLLILALIIVLVLALYPKAEKIEDVRNYILIGSFCLVVLDVLWMKPGVQLSGVLQEIKIEQHICCEQRANGGQHPTDAQVRASIAAYKRKVHAMSNSLAAWRVLVRESKELDALIPREDSGETAQGETNNGNA